MMGYCIHKINRNVSLRTVRVIRQSFQTVVEEFVFTAENN